MEKESVEKELSQLLEITLKLEDELNLIDSEWLFEKENLSVNNYAPCLRASSRLLF